jgi:short-subunit dehydrogenase
MELKGKWALITGASSGLGVDFARELAQRGMNLVLVARREDQLRTIALSLEKAHGIQTMVVPMDLGAPDVGQALQGRLTAEGIRPAVLINNAGYGVYGLETELPWDRVKAMMELDMITLVDLSRRFAKEMAAQGFGRILQVSSIGAFSPTPTYAAYAAAKAFVLSYSEALSYELKDTGVTSTALCPGITATEFLKVSGQKATPYQRLVMMKSADVARIGIRAMLRGRRSVVPGVMNTLTAWSTRLMPRRVSTWVSYLLMKQAA